MRFTSLVSVHSCVACKRTWIEGFAQEERERAEAAWQLYQEAKELLHSMNESYATYGRFGLFDANADGDNIVVTDDAGGRVSIPFLRQQNENNEGTLLCLSDFIRPLSHGIPDKLGVFATTIHVQKEGSITASGEHDEYKQLLLQTLSDRLAEATAEKLHEHVRKVEWGYAPDEKLSMHEIHIEKFQGIRPAVGYPSLPDQTLNFTLDKLLNYSAIGIKLTENGAMSPHASVSGLMVAHPRSGYFSLGKIGEDQLADYALRCGKNTEEMRKFLATNI